MVSSKLFLLCMGVLAMAIRNVRAISEAEKSKLYSSMLQDVIECTAEYDIGGDMSKLLQSLDTFDGINPCLIACIFKKSKMIDSKGLYSVEGSSEVSKKFLSSEEDLKKATEISKECSSVNEKEVSDGEKGCERAKLLAECFLPHRNLFLPNRK